MRKVNILTTELDLGSERDGYRWRGAAVGRGARAREQIGAFLYELATGSAASPYQFHHGSEDWLVVVAGRRACAARGRARARRAAMSSASRPAPAGRIRSAGPGTVLMLVGERRALEAVEYPDSGKIELRPAGHDLPQRRRRRLWDGE